MTSDAHVIGHAYDGPSHLFLVRLWMADAGEDPLDWRGRVQLVVSGEVHYFQGTEEFIGAILGMLPRNDQAALRQALEEGS